MSSSAPRVRFVFWVWSVARTRAWSWKPGEYGWLPGPRARAGRVAAQSWLPRAALRAARAARWAHAAERGAATPLAHPERAAAPAAGAAPRRIQHPRAGGSLRRICLRLSSQRKVSMVNALLRDADTRRNARGVRFLTLPPCRTSCFAGLGVCTLSPFCTIISPPLRPTSAPLAPRSPALLHRGSLHKPCNKFGPGLCLKGF